MSVRERKKNTSDYVLGRLAIGQYFLLAIGDWITVKKKHRKKKHRKKKHCKKKHHKKKHRIPYQVNLWYFIQQRKLCGIVAQWKKSFSRRKIILFLSVTGRNKAKNGHKTFIVFRPKLFCHKMVSLLWAQFTKTVFVVKCYCYYVM